MSNHLTMCKRVALVSAVLISMGVSYQAQAAQQPQVLGNDNRVQLFTYDANTVYQVRTQVGYSSLIQLGEDEEIDENSGLGMGDANAWSLAVKGRNVFFKPLKPDADTNIVLVTNKRSYAFQLSNVQGLEPPTYIARFIYPDEERAKKLAKTPPTPTLPSLVYHVGNDKNGNKLFMDADINTKYQYRGDNSIKPTNVWDNGRFTFLKFANASDLPSVYRLVDNKTEIIINTHIEKDTLVIHETGSTYRLRLGNLVGDLRNQVIKTPKFNTTGTSSKDFVRVDKNNQEGGE